MSGSLVDAWSWRHAVLQSDLPATTRHVLLTLSCFMNEVGTGCYPTQEQIAAATGLTDRAVRKHLEIACGVVKDAKGKRIDPARIWIEVIEHGFRGQKWRNHEYRAVWPEGFQIKKAAERGSGPSAKGAERGSGKVRNDVPTTSPYTIPTTPSGVVKRARGKRSHEGKPRNVIEAARQVAAKGTADVQ